MIHWPYSTTKKILAAIMTAFFLFLWSMTPANGADREVVCNDSGCSGFDNSLFANTNAVPGDSVSKTFTIKNEKSETLDVDLGKTKDAGTDDSFLSQILVVVYKNTSEVLFSGDMDDFLAGSPIDLGPIDPGSTQSYEIQLALSKDAGNEFQGSVANFSLSLNITGQESGNGEVLGTSSSDSSSTSDSSSSNSNTVVGQVLGLSDTSSGVYKFFFMMTGILLLLEGINLIASRKSSQD
jgi:hypothetical protein